MPRSVTTLGRGWRFGPHAAGAELPGFDETGLAAVTIPHTVVDLAWGDWDPATWEREWIYRIDLEPGAGPDERVFVDFDGVMTSASVFLDGAPVGEHRGGYLPWSLELALPPGTEGSVVLAVRVDARWLNVPPGGDPCGAASIDYLQPGGIYRGVRLRRVPSAFLADVAAQPRDVLSGSPSVGLEIAIDAGRAVDAAGGGRSPAKLRAQLWDAGRCLAGAEQALELATAGRHTAMLTLADVGPVELWAPDHPRLYEVRTSLEVPGQAADARVDRIGFRTARFELGGFHLNGRRLQLFGLNRHQLFPYLGMAAPDRLQRRDAELLKHELRCNMVRCSHYPPAPAFLDACDELGLLVWVETPGWQYVGDRAFSEQVLDNVRDMVRRDRNRPSVIVWGTRINESSSHRRLHAAARRTAAALDPSRPTSGAMNRHSLRGWSQDVFAYDDYQRSDGRGRLLAPIPNVPYLVSEAVGALAGPPLYRWIDDEATLAAQAMLHADVHSAAAADPAYAGLLGWAGIDYHSRNGGERIWRGLKWAGVLDCFRVPKPAAAIYRAQVDPAVAAVIAPLFRWDCGTAARARSRPRTGALIATNCERLELYVDDRPFATGVPSAGRFGHLRHPPVIVDLPALDGSGRPTLRIDGYVGDARRASIRMSSDRATDALVLTIEDSAIRADGIDMTRATVRVLDAYGNQRFGVPGAARLAVSGPAALIGENPVDFSAHGPVGGAFIRSLDGRPGRVTVTAVLDGLAPSAATLETVA